YARDTWQLVHAGAAGGHHNVHAEVATHPQVFTTLTAPGYGAVHNATGTPCHTKANRSSTHCRHGKPLRCNTIHVADDPVAGQPLCAACYDYLGHVLFAWQLPELWRRFTVTLRRAIITPESHWTDYGFGAGQFRQGGGTASPRHPAHSRTDPPRPTRRLAYHGIG
ncbi:plasmid replication initiator protein, partial [Mycobacterium persicum]